MDFLRKLLGGGQSGGDDPDGMYYYIRSNQTGEVIRVRLHRFNDLSQSDDYQSFFAHKTVVGTKSFDRIEADFHFDKGRKLTDTNLQGGVLVERSDYDAYWDAQETSQSQDPS